MSTSSTKGSNLKSFILVVSDKVYRGEKKDVSGSLAEKKLEEAGFTVIGKTVLPNDYKMILRGVQEAVRKGDLVVVIGGTGPSPRDISVDVVEKLAWRCLPGCGEVFRKLTYEKEGVAAIFTRAEMYLVEESVVIVLPGAPSAVELGVELAAKAAPHVIAECRRLEGEHAPR